METATEQQPTSPTASGNGLQQHDRTNVRWNEKQLVAMTVAFTTTAGSVREKVAAAVQAAGEGYD